MQTKQKTTNFVPMEQNKAGKGQNRNRHTDNLYKHDNARVDKGGDDAQCDIVLEQQIADTIHMVKARRNKHYSETVHQTRDNL